MSEAFSYERAAGVGTNTWLTPRWVLDPLGEFDLDPCAHRGWPIAKRHYFWPDDDGLWLPWDGRVWCNPPYGSEIAPWIERMALHQNGLLLVFARTETAAFRRVWQMASGLLFLYRRIAFLRDDLTEADSGNAPSVIVAFGKANLEALRTAKQGQGLEGALIDGWKA